MIYQSLSLQEVVVILHILFLDKEVARLSTALFLLVKDLTLPKSTFGRVYYLPGALVLSI